MIDVVIIGAGVVGCATARELSKYDLDVIVLEKSSDVSNGTSKANSGIIHGGYNSKHGTLKGQLSVKGNKMFKELDDQLHFGFNKCGSFVLAFDESEKTTIEKLYENGIKNGVEGLEIVGREFILEKEPNVNPDVLCALYCREAGIVSPYELTIALAESASLNGVDFKLNNKVVKIDKCDGHFIVQTDRGSYETKFVVNAAGLYSDEISKMVGVNKYQIKPRKGEYILLDRELQGVVNSVLFQTPSNGTKGVLVTPTYHGNIMVGPNAQFIEDKGDLSTTDEGMKEISALSKKSVPNLDLSKSITEFAGLRASIDQGDFVIEESEVRGFINLVGIDSPGLTSSPAIAAMTVDILREACLKMSPDKNFNPELKPITNMKNLSVGEKNKLIEKDPRYGRIICRCETITEGEIVEAIHRPIPALTLDAIKRRVRAGSGRCQGGFCSPRVMDIISRESSLNLEKINKSEDGSYILCEKIR